MYTQPVISSHGSPLIHGRAHHGRVMLLIEIYLEMSTRTCLHAVMFVTLCFLSMRFMMPAITLFGPIS
jgi:hypothetical protein